MHLLLRLCHWVSLAALGTLLLVVAGSVLGRAVFDLSGGALPVLLPGAIELAAYALMVMVFASLPRAALEGMIRVDVVIARLPPAVARPLEHLWRGVTGLFGAVLTWLFAEAAYLQAGRGDVTQDLEWPLWIFTGIAAASTAVLTLVLVLSICDARAPDRRSPE